MKTFTQLVGIAATSSSLAYPDSFSSLSNNNSATNVALGGALINNEHRYLLQKYFDNERTCTTVTIGATTNTTLTAVLVSGATSATLSSAWTSISTQQLVTFSNDEQRTVYFTQGSTAVNWQPPLTSAATTAIDTIGVQFYPIPPQVSKIKNDTITVGQLQYTPAPVQSIQDWTQLNALPYTSDIPNYFYIYNGQVGFWPIPSSSGNVITFNYKARVPDLTFADYSTGTLTGLSAGSNSVTGVGTTFSSIAPLNTDLTFFNLKLKITPPAGDGIWYTIKRFTSDTALLLESPLQNFYAATAAPSYVIGQIPLLHEDFHDMLYLKALMIYFSTVSADTNKYKMYETLYQQKEKMLEGYNSSKSVNVDLGSQPIQANPNLFIYSNGQ